MIPVLSAGGGISFLVGGKNRVQDLFPEWAAPGARRQARKHHPRLRRAGQYAGMT